MSTTITDIHNFLNLKRIAVVGLSRNPKDFSRMLFREMRNRGYDVVPVNPSAGELEGMRSFRSVQEITPPVEGALLMIPPRDTEAVVRDCAEASVRHVWMHRGGGQGSVSRDAAEFCHRQGIHIVEGYCPFMFLPHTTFIHRVHRFCLKLTRTYPSPSPRRGSMSG